MEEGRLSNGPILSMPNCHDDAAPDNEIAVCLTIVLLLQCDAPLVLKSATVVKRFMLLYMIAVNKSTL